MKKPLIASLILLSFVLPAAAGEDTRWWNDGEPEVILGAYFDAAGADTLFEGEIPDTVTVYLMLWNGSLRNEGGIRALEYRVELPEGLMLMRDDLPEHSHLAMGTVLGGFTQAIMDRPGNGLLINTLVLYRVGKVPYDARIRILPHPASGYLRYVHGNGSPENVDLHLLQAQDAVLNPKLSQRGFRPVRSH